MSERIVASSPLAWIKKMERNKKDNTKRTFWLNDELYELIKSNAKEQHLTASAYIAEVLTDVLNNPLYAAVKRHAKREGLTPDAYIRQAIIDRIAVSVARQNVEKSIAKVEGKGE
ncbi:MAG: hypothetical protein IJG38_03945 [Thermoguttaceae bacterium]|nr:hypothetical protein [Thermoguttaceae bacterium]